MNTEEVLGAIVAAACDPFAVIGAVARNAWAPPRATTDLDLAIAADPGSIAAVEKVLEGIGFRCVRRQRVEAGDPLPDILIFRCELGPLHQVDLLVAKTPFEIQAVARAIEIDLGDKRVPVVTPEDLVVYKLLAYRRRDQDDVIAVIRTQERSGRRTDWAHLRHWCAFWDIEDRLERLRAEIESQP